MRILIVAFDGLDYELIKKYNCENIKQEEFGKIDNYTGIKEIKTSEEFASFITGETWKKHGVKGLKKFNNSKINKLENLINKLPFSEKTKGLRGAIYSSLNFLNTEHRAYLRCDLDCKSLFEKIQNSKALFIPSYNPKLSWAIGNDVLRPLSFKEFGIKESLRLIEEGREKRERRLFRDLKNESHAFLMCHFHKPDWFHHIFWEIGEKEKIKEMYKEMDRLAKEIKKRAKDKYDYIIFMSDHGLPTEHEHNKNAFYSCNKELFPNKTPHITDFHDKILELTGEEKEISGVEV